MTVKRKFRRKKQHFVSKKEGLLNLFVKITEENLVVPCDEDGRELNHVRSVIYKNEVNSIPECTITFYPCGIIK